MNEKDMYLQALEREYQTTLRTLNAFPADHLDLKPAERSRSARELLWTFVTELLIIDGALKGEVDFATPHPAPATKQEIISRYQTIHKDTVSKIRDLSEAEWNGTISFPVAPRQMGKLRRADIFWTVLMDSVHHRGQLTVYLRLAGAKVPSVYGPTADEPWI